MDWFNSDIDSITEDAVEAHLQLFDAFCRRTDDDASALCKVLDETMCQTDDILHVETMPADQSHPVNAEGNAVDLAMSKLLTTVTALCSGVDDLKRSAESQIYPFLSSYGVHSAHSDSNIETEAAENVSQFLPAFQQCLSFVQRCNELVVNMMCQIFAFYSEQQKFIDAPRYLHLTVLFENLCISLSILVTMDHLLDVNWKLRVDWDSYLRTISFAKLRRVDLADSAVELKQLECVCRKIQFELMCGSVLQNCLERLLDQPTLIASSGSLNDEFSTQIRAITAKIECNLNKSSQKVWCQDSLVGLGGLIILYLTIFKEGDYCSKSIKTLCDANKKMPVILLCGRAEWNLVAFFQKMARLLRDKDACKKIPNNLTNEKQGCVQQIVSRAFCDKLDIRLRVSAWCFEVKAMKLLNRDNLHEELDRRHDLLLQGSKLATYLLDSVRIICSGKLTSDNELNVGKLYNEQCFQLMELVFQQIELLKIMKATFCRNSAIFNDSIVQLQQRLSALILQKVFRLNEKPHVFSSIPRDSKVDAAKILVAMEEALCRSATKNCFFTVKLCVDLLAATKSFKTDDLTDLLSSLDRLQALANWSDHMRRQFNCDFLLFYPRLSEFYCKFRCFRQNRNDAIMPFFDALSDTVRLTEDGNGFSSAPPFAHRLRIVETVNKECSAKLCEKVENDLRLSYHTHLKLDQRNPFQDRDGQDADSDSLTPFLRSAFSANASTLCSSLVDVKRRVEVYLENNFYNLTTVALHDWKTYAEMRLLAEYKYGLSPVDARLPMQTLEQGLDVLQIMRNIQPFVVNYAYNLNDQIFVEVLSSNKHLNTLNIRHVANSIRAHGVGIMNTTVNHTYQFLRQKFRIFSQFMYDDHIKSRLTKEVRYFRENKDRMNGLFPFDRAEKLVRSIRKLGMTSTGLAYMDEFRRLVTHIGNALGLVRMVRSGGLRWCAECCQFLTSEEEVLINLAPFYPQARQSLCSESAAGAFDRLTERLLTSFASSNEYFKLLVDVFAAEFANAKHAHMRNFSFIIPALMLSHVELMIRRKERLHKKHHEDAVFSDDGFAMGLAYILKVLDQHAEFDSLQWMKSTALKYNGDKTTANKTSGVASAVDEKLLQTLNLTKKRIEQRKKEFDLVHIALQSARIFFRTDPSREIIPGEPLDGENF